MHVTDTRLESEVNWQTKFGAAKWYPRTGQDRPNFELNFALAIFFNSWVDMVGQIFNNFGKCIWEYSWKLQYN